jgi:hypothetical protein
MEFEGEFETHITTEASDGKVAALRDFATRHRLKFVHILLAQGMHISQPMLTIEGRGLLSAQKNAARSMSMKLSIAGFYVTRIKIEAAPSNKDVPESDAQAVELPAALHFEHHIKLLLPSDVDLAALADLVKQHTARLSSNARRVRNDGKLERFVTQRIFNAGRTAAQHRLNNLLAALQAAGYKTLETEAEYVVCDSNQSLDAGWIEPAARPI